MLKNLGQVGTRMRPDIFDDGTLCEQPFRKLKAFTDVGNIESMSKERWGAAKWVRGQARIYCSNDFEVSKEPECTQPIMDAQRGLHSYISHKDFATMLEPAWCTKDLSNSNVMAILKRTHIIVNTSTALCIRPASGKELPVMRVLFGSKNDCLHENSRTVYDYHRKGGVDLPKDFELKKQ